MPYIVPLEFTFFKSIPFQKALPDVFSSFPEPLSFQRVFPVLYPER